VGDYTTDRVLGGSKTYNAVFTDKKDNSTLTQEDFLKLMITELTHQDMNNTADTSQMVNQMTQFSNMQAMQEMLSYSKSGYAMSLVGKTVTASRYTVSGELDTTTGKIDKVSLVDNEYIFYIGSKRYTLSQIMSVQDSNSKTTINPANFSITSSDVTANTAKIGWQVPTEDELEASGLTYTIYYSKNSDFDSVDDIVKNGEVAGVETKGEEFVISNLEAGTEYYINIIVEDSSGNKSCYKPIKIQTKSE
jgi:flagellar hook assembly protein FlgD